MFSLKENNVKYEDEPSSEREGVKSRLRGISKRKLSKEIDEIKLRKLEDYQEFQASSECHSFVKAKLNEVQEELKSLFDRYRVSICLSALPSIAIGLLLNRLALCVHGPFLA